MGSGRTYVSRVWPLLSWGGHKVNFLWNAIKTYVPQCQTVCEIGLNAGHLSVLWMESCPNAKAVLFDLPYKRWSQPTFDFLRTQYAGRVTVTEGSSLETVPAYLEKYPDTKCDVIAIDGSKDPSIRYQDFLNMQKYAHEGTLLLMDDASIERIQANLANSNVTMTPSKTLDVNDLYASLVLNKYIKIQGACSLKGAIGEDGNSTISAFYTGLTSSNQEDEEQLQEDEDEQEAGQLQQEEEDFNIFNSTA